jgi:hypothetical protein
MYFCASCKNANYPRMMVMIVELKLLKLQANCIICKCGLVLVSYSLSSSFPISMHIYEFSIHDHHQYQQDQSTTTIYIPSYPINQSKLSFPIPSLSQGASLHPPPSSFPFPIIMDLLNEYRKWQSSPINTLQTHSQTLPNNSLFT